MWALTDVIAGALFSGHFAQAKEHFAAAREHLGYVFDSSDYDVACTLCYITFVARFFAQVLCRQLPVRADEMMRKLT